MGFLQRGEVKANFTLFSGIPMEEIELVLLCTLFESLVAH